MHAATYVLYINPLYTRFVPHKIHTLAVPSFFLRLCACVFVCISSAVCSAQRATRVCNRARLATDRQHNRITNAPHRTTTITITTTRRSNTQANSALSRAHYSYRAAVRVPMRTRSGWLWLWPRMQGSSLHHTLIHETVSLRGGQRSIAHRTSHHLIPQQQHRLSGLQHSIKCSVLENFIRIRARFTYTAPWGRARLFNMKI